MGSYHGNEYINEIQGIDVIEHCPHCKKSVAPKVIYVKYGWDEDYNAQGAEIVLECPRDQCKKIYLADIVYQEYGEGNFNQKILMDYVIHPAKYEIFEDNEIEKFSPMFIEIYNQTLKADKMNLSEIIGVGYRRATEFLVKDYIKKLIRDGEIDEITEESVEKSYRTNNLIQKYVRDARIKEVAKKFFDLSNDYAHYEKIYTHRDISDLKILIQLLIYEIKMNTVYHEFETL
ncbi:hypothetical protein [Lysinibacillus sp. NPDC086135]|uniref:hypothetical protein n=1 Tax=Lysinibacillus sp. NPDC086135 TaxID=3364130 RepID=UPI00381BBA79